MEKKTKVEKSLRAQLMRFQFLKKKSWRARNSSTGQPGDADYDVGKHVTVQYPSIHACMAQRFLCKTVWSPKLGEAKPS